MIRGAGRLHKREDAVRDGRHLFEQENPIPEGWWAMTPSRLGVGGRIVVTREAMDAAAGQTPGYHWCEALRWPEALRD